MCVEVLPKRELLFQGVEDIFLQDLEEQQGDIEENTQENDIIPKRADLVIFLILPYVFIIRSTFIYVDTYIESFFVIMNTLIYGMIITI